MEIGFLNPTSTGSEIIATRLVTFATLEIIMGTINIKVVVDSSRVVVSLSKVVALDRYVLSL